MIIDDQGDEGTTVREGGLASGPVPDIDSYSIRLASDPGAGKVVYVTDLGRPLGPGRGRRHVRQPGAARQPADGLPISDSLDDGQADTIWLCTGTAATCATPNDFKRFKWVNGLLVDENNRALTFTFTRRPGRHVGRQAVGLRARRRRPALRGRPRGRDPALDDLEQPGLRPAGACRTSRCASRTTTRRASTWSR